MASKTKGKGTALLMSIASVYTAIPQCISIDKSGEKSGTYDGKTIDGPVHADRPNTGYVDNPTIKAEVFWDSGDAVHVALKALMRAPALTNFKLTDVATAPLSEIWPVTGVGIDEKYTTDDGVKASITLETSGNPS